MEPILLSLAAPSLVSVAEVFSRATAKMTNPFGSALRSAIGSPEELRTSPFEVDSLQALSEELKVDLERRIRQVLNSTGIKVDAPIRLRLSENGTGIEADLGQPDRTLLEAAFANDPSIEDDLRQLLAVQKLLSAASHNSRDASKQDSSEFAVPQAERTEVELEVSAAKDAVVLRFI